MSSFSNQQQQQQQPSELSAEALARKTEKNRINRLKFKEKKRLQGLQKEGEGGGDNLDVKMGVDKSNVNQSTNIMKNVLGMSNSGRKGKRNHLNLFLCKYHHCLLII
jgi:hypothetical protein